jgi:hypothetical protein
MGGNFEKAPRTVIISIIDITYYRSDNSVKNFFYANLRKLISRIGKNTV